MNDFKILKLKFSNMMNYHENNIIDFRKLEPYTTTRIISSNRYGKSSIVDIILFCLFDIFSRNDERELIINSDKTNMFCSLLFEINNKKYLIKRYGNREYIKTKLCFSYHNKKFNKILYSIDANNKINELIGNYDDYISSCFILQNSPSLPINNIQKLLPLQNKINKLLSLFNFFNIEFKPNDPNCDEYDDRYDDCYIMINILKKNVKHNIITASEYEKKIFCLIYRIVLSKSLRPKPNFFIIDGLQFFDDLVKIMKYIKTKFELVLVICSNINAEKYIDNTFEIKNITNYISHINIS